MSGLATKMQDSQLVIALHDFDREMVFLDVALKIRDQCCAFCRAIRTPQLVQAGLIIEYLEKVQRSNLDKVSESSSFLPGSDVFDKMCSGARAVADPQLVAMYGIGAF